MKEVIQSMQMLEIEQEIRTFLVDNFFMGQAEELKTSSPLLGSVIDSTGVLQLVMFLQDRFAITVEDDEVNAENLDSIDNVVGFVERKLRNKS
jgi:acyl carrier protein